ncbi:hypothetical protein BHE74_00002975 [Ensete ventricosum]|nr:hypothetical protein GW17_00000456 [Ensete ventricosum]RWW88158.1 hypothetical protein BHE74_00002975 [Ensete ventricosum]
MLSTNYHSFKIVLYLPLRAVRIGLSADWHADCSLPGGTRGGGRLSGEGRLGGGGRPSGLLVTRRRQRRRATKRQAWTRKVMGEAGKKERAKEKVRGRDGVVRLEVGLVHGRVAKLAERDMAVAKDGDQAVGALSLQSWRTARYVLAYRLVCRYRTEQDSVHWLSWGCNGDKSGQQKHEVVSFERGDITTAERSIQILLKWETHPQTVLILTKPNSNSVRILCAEMVRYVL